MRLLFTFLGGLGHFRPLVPVARAAQAAGHEVAFACGAKRAVDVEAAGFRCFATSMPSLRRTPPPEPAAFAPSTRLEAEVEFAQNFATTGARRHAAALPEHLRSWRPDLLVRDEADLGAPIAAELHGLPCATVLVLASGLLIRPDLVGPPLAALRAEHGLAPDPGLRMLTGDLVLAPYAASFRSPDSPVPLPAATFHFRPGPMVPVSTRTGRRRVYVTLGTVFNTDAGDLFERLLAGVADVDADVLVTVGHDVDPSAFGPQPAHVRVERFVPQAEVLTATDLVVSHGGSGSLLATLEHGLPSVLLPLGADQPHNALRAAELGLARTLDALSATPAEIGAAVGATLADPAMRERAAAVAAEVAALPGAEETVARLEALVR